MSAFARLIKVEFRTADNEFFLKTYILVEDMTERKYFRLTLIVHEREHIYRKTRLQRGLREQVVENDLRVGVAFEFDNYAHTVAVAFFAKVGYAFEPLVLDLIGDVFDELAFVYLIR